MSTKRRANKRAPAGLLHGRPPGEVSHHSGRPTQYVTLSTGRRSATALEVADLVEDQEALEWAASSALLQFRDATGEHNLALNSGPIPEVTSLLEVRRPHSYPEMGSRTGKFPPPQGGDRGIWYESRNERSHFQDLVVSGEISAMAAQPFQVRWPVGAGELRHIVDCICAATSGRCLMVDVTTEYRLVDPRDQAKFRLSALTADLMGWDYQLRAPMSTQRTINVGHIHSYRRAADVEQRQRWLESAAELKYPQPLGFVARRLSNEDLARGRAAIMHLLSYGLLFVDLEGPLNDRTTLHIEPQSEEPSWVRHL